MHLKIDPDIFIKMRDHARLEYPFECCGFFFGNEINNIRIVRQVLPVNNAREGDKRRRFEVAPQDYMKAEQYADEKNLELLGVYHSHPDHPARPSQHDLDQAAPNFSYIIISLDDKKILDATSWRLQDTNQFVEEEIDQ